MSCSAWRRPLPQVRVVANSQSPERKLQKIVKNVLNARKGSIAANKQMNVIGHDHVSPNRDIELHNRAMTVLLENTLSMIPATEYFCGRASQK